MSDDASSTLEIRVNTTADPAALKAVNAELKETTIITKQAAEAGGALVVAHKSAGEAAVAHAGQHSTLRLAMRGSNDAAFALADLMSGNFAVAFHRAKFAVEDLGLAMRTAFLPTAAIIGVTLAVEGLAWAFQHTGEQAEEAKKQADETAKAMEAAAKAGAERIKALADEELKSIGAAKAEADALIKSLQELESMADKGRAKLDKMTDARAAHDSALADQQEAQEMLGAKDDVQRAQIKAKYDRQRAGIKAGAESEKVVREQQAAAADLAQAQGSQDDTAHAVGLADDAAQRAAISLEFRQRDARDASEGRVAAEARAAAAAKASNEAVRNAPRGEKQRQHMVEAGEEKHAADQASAAARVHDAAAQKNLEDAEKAASATAAQAAHLKDALEQINAKVKVASDKLEIATMKADTQAIKSGLEAGGVDKAGSSAVLAAQKKQNEEAQKTAERDRAANIAANQQEQEGVKNKIAAVELRVHAGEKDQAQLQKDLDKIQELKRQLLDLGLAREALQNAVTGQPSQVQSDAHALALAALETTGGVPVGHGSTLIGGTHPHGSLTTGGLTTGHVQGGSTAGTDWKAAFRPHIDTRTTRQRQSDEAFSQAAADLSRDDVQSAISATHSAMNGSQHDPAQIRELIRANQQLLELFTQHTQTADVKGEIEKLKQQIDTLNGQLKNNRH